MAKNSAIGNVQDDGSTVGDDAAINGHKRRAHWFSRCIIEIAFSLSACGVVAATVAAFYLTDQTNRADQWVLQTSTALAKLERLHLTMVEAESAGRSYLAGEVDGSRERYELAVNAVDYQLASMRDALSGNEQQLLMLSRLEQTVARRFALLGAQVGLHARKVIDGAVLGELAGGVEQMRSIKAQILAMTAAQNRLLDSHREAQVRSTSVLEKSLAGFSILALFATAGLFWKMKSLWSARLRAEAQALHEAHFDALTGLPNRRLLRDRLGIALARARRKDGMVAIFAMDLDGFKQVNDRLGHGAGDEVLQLVALRLKDLLRAEDTAARVGGDEFVVVLSELTAPSYAENIAARTVLAIAEPFKCGSDSAQIGASLGIALYPRDGESAEELLANADKALYSAKARGKGTYATVARSVYGADQQQVPARRVTTGTKGS